MDNMANVFSQLLPLVVLVAIFYFLIIRPQQKQVKNHKDMVDSLSKGDKIITNGGLMVEIVKVEETHFMIRLNDQSIVKLSKEYVAKKIEQ